MISCKFEFPCSPNDTVYYVTSYGVVRLLVMQLQVVRDINNELSPVVCFYNYPFITLEEANKYLFGTYEEAKRAYGKEI